MTIAVDWDIKPQTSAIQHCCLLFCSGSVLAMLRDGLGVNYWPIKDVILAYKIYSHSISIWMKKLFIATVTGLLVHCLLLYFYLGFESL